jgi:hypothetical protein
VNLDGQVTGDDYTVIDSNLNTTPVVGIESISGDANRDGSVTGDDYTTVDSNLGSGVGNPLTLSAVTVVPEPASALVVALGIFASMPRRRRGSPLSPEAAAHRPIIDLTGLDSKAY